jgi:hypothetical protein
MDGFEVATGPWDTYNNSVLAFKSLRLDSGDTVVFHES